MGGGGGGGGCARTSFSSLNLKTTCKFTGPTRHIRDFLYQRVLGHMYCRAWSIHKPSANVYQLTSKAKAA